MFGLGPALSLPTATSDYTGEIISNLDWAPTLVAAAGDSDVKKKLHTGLGQGWPGPIRFFECLFKAYPGRGGQRCLPLRGQFGGFHPV